MRFLRFPIACSVVLIGCTLIGCASHIPMTPESGRSMANKEIAVGKRVKPDFAAVTAGKAMFGVVGAVAMISAGNDIVSKHNLEDPAGYIGDKIRAALSAAYGAKATTKSVAISDDDVQAISQNNFGTELVLDVRTMNWSFGYFPTTWSRYRVIYSARLRLIDTTDHKVIAEGTCSRVPDETPNAPTYEELLTRDAERLKKELKDAAEFCVGEFKAKVLQL